jgi:hypothetical protein
LACFETNAVKLSANADYTLALSMDLAACLSRSSAENVTRVSNFMQDSAPAGFAEPGQSSAGSDLTKLIAQASYGCGPYERAKIFQILVNWHVLGSQVSYLQAVSDCSLQQGTWAYPNSEDPGRANLEFSKDSNDPAAWKRDDEALANMAFVSRDVKLTVYFLKQVGGKPSNESILKAASLLLADDEALQSIVVERLHEWVGGEGTTPQQGIVDGRRRCINLQSLVQYWRKKYGIGGR